MKEEHGNVMGRLGYWLIIGLCIAGFVRAEVRSRELEYNEIYLRGSNNFLLRENLLMRTIYQEIIEEQK